MIERRKQNIPVMVPCTTEPFLSSIVTVSLFSFIKNLNGEDCVSILLDSVFVLSRSTNHVPYELHDGAIL
jgi:hypothetical protein